MWFELRHHNELKQVSFLSPYVCVFESTYLKRTEKDKKNRPRRWRKLERFVSVWLATPTFSLILTPLKASENSRGQRERERKVRKKLSALNQKASIQLLFVCQSWSRSLTCSVCCCCCLLATRSSPFTLLAFHQWAEPTASLFFTHQQQPTTTLESSQLPQLLLMLVEARYFFNLRAIEYTLCECVCWLTTIIKYNWARQKV